MFGAKVIIMIMRSVKIKYCGLKLFKMIGILIPLLLPIILLEVVSFIPVILSVPLLLLKGLFSESIVSESSTDVTVSLMESLKVIKIVLHVLKCLKSI